MGWQTDDGNHEGWVAPTFHDGALGSGWGAPDAERLGRQPQAADYGVLVARIGDRTLEHDAWQYRPATEVTGWVSVCECGWRGTPWTRADQPAEQDLTARRAYPADFGDPPQEVEGACHTEWRDHTRPDAALADLERLAGEYATLARRLDQAVAQARTAGASWTAIGAAAGITRQSAHERWKHLA